MLSPNQRWSDEIVVCSVDSLCMIQALETSREAEGQDPCASWCLEPQATSAALLVFKVNSLQIF